jgi:hypothetical protein
VFGYIESSASPKRVSFLPGVLVARIFLPNKLRLGYLIRLNSYSHDQGDCRFT